MAFWTRFLKRKSPLLDAQEKSPGQIGLLKKLIAFLVRQKLVWIYIGLSLVICAGGTYYAIKVRPYLLEKKAGVILESPRHAEDMMAGTAKPVIVGGEMPEIKESVVESRNEAVAFLRQAEIHYSQGAIDQAKEELQRAIALTSDTSLLSTAYANLANILDGEGRYAQAIQFLQRALTFDRQFVKGYHNLGIVYMHMHDYDKAQLAFQMSIRQAPDFAPSHAGLAEIHTITGNLAAAIQSFTESLRLREDPNVRLNLALAFLQSGNHMQAMEHLTLVEKSAPDPYSKYLAYFNRADALAAKGRHEEAVLDYQSALALAPKDMDVMFNLGLSLMVLGKKEEALASFRRVIELDPENMDAYFNAVTLHSDLGQYQEALNLLRPIRDRIPQHKQVNYMLGHLYHRLGKLGESHEFFNHVFYTGQEELQPQLKADAIAGLASVFDDSGDLAGAEFLFQEALRIKNTPWLHHNLARTYRRSRKLEHSIKEATTALDMEPANYTFMLALAEVLYDAELLTKAFDMYKQAADLAPKEYYPRYMMAYTASRQRLWTTALAEYNRLLTSGVEGEVRGAVYKGIGNVYHEQENYDQALAAYREAVTILPKDSSVYYNIARTYFQMARLDECAVAVKKSIDLDPKSSESWTLLGTYYFKKGLIDKARESFEEAVKLNPENLEAYYNRDVVRKQQ